MLKMKPQSPFGDSAEKCNIGYWGWNGYWQTRFRLDPENDLVLILLTNAFTNPKWDAILGGYDAMLVHAIED